MLLLGVLITSLGTISMAAANTNTLEVAYGWGVDHGIANRTVVTHNRIYVELLARMKGPKQLMGQNIYAGVNLVDLPYLQLRAGAAIWHQNGTGKIDNSSAWLRLTVRDILIPNAGLEATWAFDHTDYRVYKDFDVSEVLPFIRNAEVNSSIRVSYERSYLYEGIMVGLRTSW